MPRLSSYFWKIGAGVALLSFGLTSGCALINPHVTWPRPDPPVALDRAIKYANDGREAYKKGVATYSTVPNVLAMGLIPLGAGAIGAAFGGAHSQTIGYLALAGAGAFGLGQWFNNPLRQEVYIAGMNGITCAVEAVLPLKIDKAGLSMGLDHMRKYGAEAEGHAREVARLIAEIDAGVQTPQSQAAARSLASAKEVLARAQQTLADGYVLLDLHERAGELLTTKIGEIDTLVTRQLKNTQADVDSLRLLVQGLGQSVRTLIPVSGKTAELLGAGAKKEFEVQAGTPEEVRQEERRTKLSEQLDARTKDMNIAVGQLSIEASRVNAIVDGAVRSKPSETLKKCGVDEVELTFTLDPPTGLTLPRGKIASITAVGGKTPFSSRLEPQPAQGVSIVPPVGSDRTFTFAASADAPIQEYDLRVEDALHNVQRTKVRVVEAPPSPAPPSPAAGAGGGTGTARTASPVLDEKSLKEFATAIRMKTFTDGGLTITVGDTHVDSTNKIVTTKIVSVSGAKGAKVSDDQIREALLAEGGGPARGMKRENIKIDRTP
jgi:hypothetical protein